MGMPELADLDGAGLWDALVAAAAGARDGAAGAVAQRCRSDGASRLGFVLPPPWPVVRARLAAVRAALGEGPGALLLLGTGGWSFAVEALTEVVRAPGVVPLDSLDPAAIRRAWQRCGRRPAACLAVSASGATEETRRLAALLPVLAREFPPPEGPGPAAGAPVWLRDEPAPPHAFSLSLGHRDQVAMLGAPLSTAFLVPASLLDPTGLARAYQRLRHRYHRLGATAAGLAATMPVRGRPALRFAPPAWAGGGLRRWLLQLGRQVLGGKSGESGESGAFRPTVDLADPGAAGGAYPGLDLTGTARTLPALLELLYLAGVYVACVALRAGVPVAAHDNVNAYKRRLADPVPVVPPPSLPVLSTADLPGFAARWLAGRPHLRALHLVAYDRAGMVPVARMAAATGRPCEVHAGSAWNHHSFQAGYACESLAVLIVAPPVPAATDPLRPAALAQRAIALATRAALPGRSVAVEVAARSGR